jgi:hypothetical protein
MVLTLQTDDGFEFETTREGRAVRCVCRRHGREAILEITYGWDHDPDTIPTELIELYARNGWEAGERIARRQRGDRRSA